MVFKTDRPLDNHQAIGKPITNNSAVVIAANFKVSHIGDRSIT